MNTGAPDNSAVRGEFIDIAGERFYAIRNVHKIPPFFISVISNVDHWLFISSTGGLTAGRVSPDTALFPYITVDKIYDSVAHTGSKTVLQVQANGKHNEWEPFNIEHDGRYDFRRHLYKSTLGNKLCFEEVNFDLALAFRYSWMTSDRYGFVRQCELENLGAKSVRIDMVDGLQNILPAGTPSFTQANSSNLVDAYKRTELDSETGLALFTLYSGITDRAEPCESLKANTAFCLGLEGSTILISSEQLETFRVGSQINGETSKRGIRGAFLVNATLDLAPRSPRDWQIVANIEQTQGEVVALQNELQDPAGVAARIAESIDQGSDELARIMAAADSLQATAEEDVATHHYANVLFNVLRGGLFDDQYQVSKQDFISTVQHFNRVVFERNRELLESLPEQLQYADLLKTLSAKDDHQLQRLCLEYLPITFGRRHGDPSRPWNKFAIKLTDDQGKRLLSYEGNWRDIFQNWEALALSYPEFVENMIAKFVNASTMDGYNPYRITKEGIDWEVEEPDDPWSYIGYWGDHQIIYLQKLLELSSSFHPARLSSLLRQPVFCYANVPYRIRPFADLLRNPKVTVDYDHKLADRIEQRVEDMGADGKLVLDADGNVYQVNLLEKLLVPLLAKLGNLVIDGGIWLNTQRPEWNDANNALVGQGLSMVTLYYMRRYIRFLQELLAGESGAFDLSIEVSKWIAETAAALAEAKPLFGPQPFSPEQRFALLEKLGLASSQLRESAYARDSFQGTTSEPLDSVIAMLDDALAAIDHTIGKNRRADGLFEAYNTLELRDSSAHISNLYPMLEGQVAALSAGAVVPEKAVEVIESLFRSEVYRPDQHSFMLYPDKQLTAFLDKNRVPAEGIKAIPLLTEMLESGDNRLIVRDLEGAYRFNAELTNVGDLDKMFDELKADYGASLEAAQSPLKSLYEAVFNHRAFTGRSGGMFGFEGLGCIYWHMVAKLLLAAQENYFSAVEQAADADTCKRLGELYYRVRSGIGFNKTPGEYGAFPYDPYSHTPIHSGAQQPGMTGQVKEEIISRFGELGVRVNGGVVRFAPSLLRPREFTSEPRSFRYLDVGNDWQEIDVPVHGLAFTWCQVPVVYVIDDASDPAITISSAKNEKQRIAGTALPAEHCKELFQRTGKIRQLRVTFKASTLFAE